MAFVFRSERNLCKSQDENINNYLPDQVNKSIFSKQNDNEIKDTNLVNNRYSTNALDTSAPPFLSGEKRLKKSKENTPGPGAYNICYDYYNKHRQFSSRQDNAIPEEYDLFDLPLLRMKEVINDNPGPGHYHPSEKDLFGGKFRKMSFSLNSKKNNNNNSSSSYNNISKRISILIRQSLNKNISNDIDKNINRLLYISSPRHRISENSAKKKKFDEGRELVENISMKNIRSPLSIKSIEDEKKKKENSGRRINDSKNNNSKVSGVTLDTERTSINSSKLSYSQARNNSSKIVKKINYQSNKNILSDNQEKNLLYNRLVSSTEHNAYKNNILFPTLKYDKSRIYKNEKNHERLLFEKEQKTNNFSNNLSELEKLLNEEYFSQAPGPGYYDPIDSPNQKYFTTKNIKNIFNSYRGKKVTSLIKENKVKKGFPGPGHYRIFNNMIENNIKTILNKKMRNMLFDVKKIAKLRIIREKETSERNKVIKDILSKEKNNEKQKSNNNTKEIYQNDNNIMKYKVIHTPKNLLFNFGSNDKRFKDPQQKIPGPGEYDINLYKSIEEKNSNIVEAPNFIELYDRLENKNNLLERSPLNKELVSTPPVGHYNPDIISSIKYNFEYKNQIKMPVICRNISSKSLEEKTFKKVEEIKEKEKKLLSLLGPGKYFSMLNRSMKDMNKNKKNEDNTKSPPFGSGEQKFQDREQIISPGPGHYDINLYHNWITRTYNILFS